MNGIFYPSLPDDILDLVAMKFEIQREALIGSSKDQHVVRAQNVSGFLILESTGSTIKEIAPFLQRPSHHIARGKKAVGILKESDINFLTLLNQLRQAIKLKRQEAARLSAQPKMEAIA